MMRSKNIEIFRNYYLPEELLQELLARLPAKSLLRFRCVSKAICKMVDDPEFVSLHMKTYKKNYERSLVLTMETVESRKQIITARHFDTFERCDGLVLETWDNINGERCLASIDGLVLMDRWFEKDTLPLAGRSSLLNRISIWEIRLRVLEVWNPFVKKSLILPPVEIRSPCTYTLGFACSTNDYKVGLFNFQNNSFFKPSCSIYSFSRGCWRTLALDAIATQGKWRMSHESTSSKRATHWLAGVAAEEVSGSVSARTSYTHIASFDFDVEEFSFTKLPREKGIMLLFPFVIDNSIALLGISPTSTRIWILKKDGGEEPWTSWYSGGSTITAYNFFDRYRYRYSHNHMKKILYMEKAGNSIFLINTEDFYVELGVTESRVYSYDLKSHRVSRIGNCIRSPYLLDAYMESLLLCKGPEGHLTFLP